MASIELAPILDLSDVIVDIVESLALRSMKTVLPFWRKYVISAHASFVNQVSLKTKGRKNPAVD